MTGKVIQCPHCQGRMRVPAGKPAEKQRCPHCRKPLGASGTESTETGAKPTSSVDRPAEKSATIVANCPACRGKFRVPRDSATLRVACPHCQQQLAVAELLSVSPDSEPEKRTKAARTMAVRESPTTEREHSPTLEPAPTSSEVESSAAAKVETDNPPMKENGVATDIDPECAKLLPPKFLLPPETGRRRASDDVEVFLPRSEGGFQAIDPSVRIISYGGRTVAVKSLGQRTKRRRQWVRSMIVIVICAIILIVTIRLLMRAIPEAVP